jgi:hypothetical protein
MSRIRLHPFSVLVGASTLVGVFWLGGMAQVGLGGTTEPGLTQSQQEILSHLSLVFLRDAEGNVTKTLRVSGVNLQVVNGLGSTSRKNGLGNLLMGYSEVAGSGARGGSHNVVLGAGQSYGRESELVGNVVIARGRMTAGDGVRADRVLLSTSAQVPATGPGEGVLYARDTGGGADPEPFFRAASDGSEGALLGGPVEAPLELEFAGLPLSVSSIGAPAEGTGIAVAAQRADPFTPSTTTGLDAVAFAFSEQGADATGVRAHAETVVGSGSGSAVGVRATASDEQFGAPRTGVHATAFGEPGVGVRAETTGSFASYAVLAEGDLGVTGSKDFVHPHPEDPDRVIRFSALEGNESGTYFRGTARLEGGVARIPVPEAWRHVTEAEGVTVQVSPVGDAKARVAVRSQGRDEIVIAGEPDVTFNYLVNGVRRGFAEHRTYDENVAFRPVVRGVPFGTQYPLALRQALVENGILRPDYTPNEATAERLGWRLLDPGAVRAEERWWLPAAERRRAAARRSGER